MSDIKEKKEGLIKKLMRYLRNYFVIVGLIVTCLFVLLIFAVSNIGKSKGGDIKFSPVHPAMLKIKMSKTTFEATSIEDMLLEQLTGTNKSLGVLEILDTIEKASYDKRIGGVFLDFNYLNMGFAKAEEIRSALLKFKNKGKYIYAHLNEHNSNMSYYMASVANFISINPAASFMLNGPTFNLVYFADALKKLGVDINVVRNGKYKSAFEMFVNNKASAETKEMYNTMLSSFLETLSNQISVDRNKTTEEVISWFKQTLYTAKTAKQAGIVDYVGYSSDINSEQLGKNNFDDKLIKLLMAPVVTFNKYRRIVKNYTAHTPLDLSDDGIAILNAKGEIRMSNPSYESGIITPESFKKQLRWAEEEDDVKAVIIRIDSPGGSAVASDIIWNDISQLRKKKPIVVSMAGVAASGGYYMASAANLIIANKTTITGSIGVLSMIPSLSGFGEKYGVHFDLITISERKSLLHSGEKLNEEDIDLFAKSGDRVYAVFLEKVALSRNKTVAEVDLIAQGRVYTGAQAKQLGLIDELGGIESAINSAKKLAKFDVTKKYKLYKYKKESNLMDCFKNPLKVLSCLDEQKEEIYSTFMRAVYSNRSVDEVILTRVKRLLQLDRSGLHNALYLPAFIESVKK